MVIARMSTNTNFHPHAPRGAQPTWQTIMDMMIIFLLTRPSRGATDYTAGYEHLFNISTHTPLAGRNFISLYTNLGTQISTHTPLAGRNIFYWVFKYFEDISTHTPLAGRNNTGQWYRITIKEFLLTRPSRGATSQVVYYIVKLYISTHTPLAGRNLIHFHIA